MSNFFYNRVESKNFILCRVENSISLSAEDFEGRNNELSGLKEIVWKRGIDRREKVFEADAREERIGTNCSSGSSQLLVQLSVDGRFRVAGSLPKGNFLTGVITRSCVHTSSPATFPQLLAQLASMRHQLLHARALATNRRIRRVCLSIN